MKAAILFFGQYREFDTCVAKWKVHFENHLECDYFVSTWNTSRQKYNYLEPDTPENIKEFVVTEELIKNTLRDSVCSVLDERSVFIDDTPQDDSEHTGRAIRQAKMFYHWKNLHRMLKESQKNYDVVILLRSDIVGAISNDDGTFDNAVENWKFNKSILYNDSNMVVRMDGDGINHLVNDYLFCGSMAVMEKFFNVIPDMDEVVNKYHTWTPHIDLANLLIKENLYVSNLHPFKVRGLTRPVKKVGYSSFAPVF